MGFPAFFVLSLLKEYLLLLYDRFLTFLLILPSIFFTPSHSSLLQKNALFFSPAF